MRLRLRHAAGTCLIISSMIDVSAQQKYDFLLKGGHVIDPRNRISAVRDVAIANGKVAAVAANIDPAEALKVVDASGSLRHAGARGHSRPRLRRHGRTRILRRRQQPVSRRLHVTVGRHHRRRRRIVGLEELRGLQGSHHRSLQDARAGVSQHRRPRDARRSVRAEPGRHGSQADGGDGAAPQRRDRRHQDGSLRRT